MSKNKIMYIAVDFDGTVVEHAYPDTGKDVPGAVKVLKALVDEGHKLILWTMRSGQGLEEAENWYKEKGIPLYGVQRNPTQDNWTSSPKAYAHIYIDDAALGCPLVQPPDKRAFVDWQSVVRLLKQKGVLL